MFNLETLILLLAIVSLCTMVAHHFKWPEPILLVLTGMLLSLLPGLHRIQLEPALIFTVFLPPILYLNAWATSWRDLKANTRIMIQMAIVLVIASTFVVGLVGHALIPALPFAAALALGAIVSPPDAVAASAITEQLSVPRRIVTVLEGESLLNDATALVLLGFAVTAVMTGSFSLNDAILRFWVVALGGIVVGIIIGWLMSWIRYRVDDTPVEITLSLLTPYLAYIPAETLHVSGVLSCVTAGLYIGWKAPRMMSSMTRMESKAVWNMLMYLLNGMIFLLTGLQLPVVLEALQSYAPLTLATYAVGIISTVIVARLIYVFMGAYIPRLLFKSLREKDPYPGWRNVFIIAWSGMRGAISLAAALALPIATMTGQLFPERDLIIFLTFSVILGTLVFQGLTLPWIIRFLKVEDDSCYQCDELEARMRAAKAALSKLDQWGKENKINLDNQEVQAIRSQYQSRIETYHAFTDAGPERNQDLQEQQRLHLKILGVERDLLIELRNQGEIKEEVLSAIQRDLDLQELHLRQQPLAGGL